MTAPAKAPGVMTAAHEHRVPPRISREVAGGEVSESFDDVRDFLEVWVCAREPSEVAYVQLEFAGVDRIDVRESRGVSGNRFAG